MAGGVGGPVGALAATRDTEPAPARWELEGVSRRRCAPPTDPVGGVEHQEARDEQHCPQAGDR